MIAFKGGLAAATFNQKHRVNLHGPTGGIAGHLRGPLGRRCSLAGQIELLYTARGAETVFEGVPSGTLRLHYLDLTVAARPEVRLGSVGVYLWIGGGLDLLIRADDENAVGVTWDVTAVLHRIDVALIAGVGAALHLPRQRMGPFRLGAIFVEARHDRGLLDIDTKDLGFKNRTSSLMLGLSFALGSR